MSILVALCLAIIVGIFALLVGLRLGLVQTILVASLLSIAVLPRTLFAMDSDKYVGIAPSAPSFATYDVVLLGSFVLLALTGRLRRLRLWILPFVLWLSVGMLFVWQGSTVQFSGLLHLLLVPMSLFVGAALGRAIQGHAGPSSRFMALALFIMVVQLLACLIQLVGFPLNPMEPAQALLLQGRHNGLLGHPNDLGKLTVVLLAMSLAVSSTRSSKSKNLIVPMIVVSLAVLALTGGRAVLLGAVAMLVLWALMLPRTAGSSNRKIIVLGGVLVAALSVSGVLLSRFDEDPTGGARSDLLGVALDQISRQPIWGVGPNSYVEVVGARDSLTATGVPVHNAALLAATELGIPGAILLALPIFSFLLWALKPTSRRGPSGSFSRAFLAFLPALFLMGYTGWGLLGSSILPLLFLALGFLSGGARSPKLPPDEVSPIEAHLYAR